MVTDNRSTRSTGEGASDRLVEVWRSIPANVAVVDTIPHVMTGHQMLYAISVVWATTRLGAAVLAIPAGTKLSVQNSIRVALSRERAARKVRRQFELVFSDSVPFTYTTKDHVSLPAEFVVVTRSAGSKSVQLAAAFERLNKKGNLI